MRRPRGLALLALGLLAASVGCKTPKPRDGASGDFNTGVKPLSASTLGAGDLIEVRVFRDTDLSGVFRVSPEGTIDYPLCGRVDVASKTSSATADVLTACLKNGFLKDPQVTVLIREFNSKKVFVFGEVNKPGTFPYEESMSIIQAITLAGGFTKVAAKNNINVTRQVDGQEKKVRVAVEDIGVGREKNFLLQPGDIVFIPESFF